jgi:chromosome segregation ATPase
MENMKKLIPEELQSIKDLQSRYNQVVFEIGVTETQIIAFQQQIEKFQEEKKNLISDLTTISKQESELIKTLEEKYGSGNINSETGEITSIQQ